MGKSGRWRRRDQGKREAMKDSGKPETTGLRPSEEMRERTERQGRPVGERRPGKPERRRRRDQREREATAKR